MNFLNYINDTLTAKIKGISDLILVNWSSAENPEPHQTKTVCVYVCVCLDHKGHVFIKVVQQHNESQSVKTEQASEEVPDNQEQTKSYTMGSGSAKEK